jgi:putative membrane protein
MQSIQRTALSPFIPHLLTATALAASLAAGAASAQTSGAADTSRSTTTTTTAATARDAASGAAQIQRADRKLIDDIAQSNLAEIATGRIALDTSKDERVRKFAQTMIDDHTTAMADVQQLAQAKAVALPDGPDLKHKTMATALKAMSGETFDRQYMSHAGVDDHQRTLDLLKKTQRDAKDPQLKALAVKMIPVVQAHLDEAHRVAPTAKH